MALQPHLSSCAASSSPEGVRKLFSVRKRGRFAQGNRVYWKQPQSPVEFAATDGTTLTVKSTALPARIGHTPWDASPVPGSVTVIGRQRDKARNAMTDVLAVNIGEGNLTGRAHPIGHYPIPSAQRKLCLR